MDANDKLKALDFRGRDFPLIRGDVKFTLKNVHNGKTEVQEHHNIVTNALADIFGNNYGGLLNYQNFADLFKTYMGGVLLFRDPLDDTDASSYGIPALTSNPVVAHAGQTPMTSQRDDTTRGDPDDYGTLVQENSTKLTFEWGTSAGNAPLISSLGLTHTDVGSFGCGVNSDAQKQLNPFADVAVLSRTYAYGQNAHTPLAIHGERGYNVFMVDDTTVNIYSFPINNHKFKLQGGALLPLGDYETVITATIQDYNINGSGCFYYHFDFDNNKLVLFGIETEGGAVLLIDEINLTSGAVTSSSITITGAKLWKFTVKGGLGQDYRYFTVPTPAIIHNNNVFVYGYTSDNRIANKMWRVNLAQPADFAEVDTTAYNDFTGIVNQAGYSRVGGKYTTLGGLIIQDSFIVNGDKTFGLNSQSVAFTTGIIYGNPNGISAPVFGANVTSNMIAVNKCYLATKFNLPQPVQKTASQSMTVEYTLTEI